MVFTGANDERNQVHRHVLSKSRYTDGLQCAKRLWLGLHEPHLATPPDQAQQAVFDTGNRVGEIARLRWPSGVLVDELYWDHEGAVTNTKKLLADASTEAIFEAGFMELGVRVRADIMAKVPGTDQWDLIEVKSSTSPKPQYDDDIAIQALVIETAGISLRKTMILVVNNRYIFDGHELDPGQLLALHDRSEEVRGIANRTRDSLEKLHEVAGGNMPDVTPSRHCFRPYECPFWDHCSVVIPENSIWQIPRLSDKKFLELQTRGIERISDVPGDFPLSEKQEIVRRATVSGREWISDDLGRTLLNENPRTYFIDFETINPGVPMYEGTRPFEKVPFQWSCHTRTDDGNLEHDEFLADPSVDPRKPFAESLLTQLEPPGPIVVYSGFEKGVISALADRFPDLSDQLLSISDRLWDLYKVINANYYHAGFKGSYSIKSVLPALAPDLAYDDLVIQSGGSASAVFMSLVTSESRDEQDETMLKEYCARDTLAMVAVLDRLRQIAAD